MKIFIEYHFKKIAAVLILMYGIVNLYCSTKLSINGDEANFYEYGVKVLKGNPEKKVVNGFPVYTSHMPIMAINVLPRAIHQFFNRQLKHDELQTGDDIKQSRVFSVISSMLLALYVLVWATQLYGKTAGIFSLLLYVLCPNVMAHSQMASTDVYSFLICTAVCYHAWRFAKTCDKKQLLFVAVWLALGQLTKQSLLLLYPVVWVFLALRLYVAGIKWNKLIVTWLKQVIIIKLVALLIINCGFLFYKTGTPLNQYHFISTKYIGLQQKLSFAGNIPIPLPQPYIYGFDFVSFNQQMPPGITGLSSYGATSFLGKKITGERIWYYYAVCCLYKMPIPFLIMLFLSFIFYLRSRERYNFFTDEMYLLLPACFIFICFSLFNNMYLGIRSILLIFPLLFIFSGSLIQYISWRQKKSSYIIIGLLLVWQFISVVRYFPHFLPYTNEFILDKTNAYKIFGDSNIYYGEGIDMMKQYLQQHPDIQFEPANAVHGRVMVSIDEYDDSWFDGKMQWLRNMQLKPAGNFDSQYLVFNVP